ncbi:hypothetical protein ABIG06_001962 [Bradyrhizobium sp. USDA 326]|uniref:hypothetical protein n=1 Tax=unclassified Bradyrhizobium TaxID=2631580 RepID=UPI0035117371
MGIAHSPLGYRIKRSRFDLIGADAPERLSAVQISGKNVDVNIMAGTYSPAEHGIKMRWPPVENCLELGQPLAGR